MARLIDADALLRMHWVLPNRMTRETALECFRNIINEATTIDAEPVRHGRWMFEFALDDSNFYRCSECNRQEVLLAKESINEWCPYCHCGAKMDGGAEDG